LGRPASLSIICALAKTVGVALSCVKALAPAVVARRVLDRGLGERVGECDDVGHATPALAVSEATNAAILRATAARSLTVSGSAMAVRCCKLPGASSSPSA